MKNDGQQNKFQLIECFECPPSALMHAVTRKILEIHMTS